MTRRPRRHAPPAASLALSLTLIALPAAAQDHAPATCAPAVHAWATRCAATGAPTSARLCPSDALVIAQVGALRVELTRDPRRGFRRAGPWGVSPIGNFADWNTVSPPLRAALDQAVRCAAADPLPAAGLSTGFEPRRGAPLEAPTVPASRIPWLPLGALVGVLAAHRLRRRSLPSPALFARPDDRLALALTLATPLLRAAVAPSAFFHQNGHGPAWVAHLLAPTHHPYGPGYRELFGPAALCWPASPEVPVFALQSLLGALAVGASYVTARALALPRAAAAATAFALALDPVFARLSRSESHYGAQSSLLLLAGAVLLRAPQRLRDRGFALATLAAGLLMAESMRLHPVAWVASALTPLVLLFAPGSLLRRLRRTLAALALTGLTAALFVVPTMRAVLGSSLGTQWAPRALTTLRALAHGAPRAALPTLALLAVSALVLRPPLRTVLRALPRAVTALTVLALMSVADVLPRDGVPPWVHGAYARLYAAPLLAALLAPLARLATTRLRARLVAATIALIGLVSWCFLAPLATHLPTDAIEQNEALRWRTRVPSDARVLWLERAGEHIVTLPLYAGSSPPHPTAAPQRTGADAPPTEPLPAGTWWYRASTCTTREGAPWCEAFERAHTLTPVWTRSLPADPSVAYLPFNAPRVTVGLYRVTR